MQAMAGIRPSPDPSGGDGSWLLPAGVDATSMHGLGASLGSTVCCITSVRALIGIVRIFARLSIALMYFRRANSALRDLYSATSALTSGVEA
jgi:hypothetical protein